MKTSYLLVFSMLISASVQIHATGNCDNPQTQLEMNDCSGRQYQHEDAKLNRNYKDLIRRLKQSEKERLKAVQRSWIKFRDLQCEFEASRYEGGSIQPLIRSNCLTEMTKQRNKELRAMIEDASR